MLLLWVIENNIRYHHANIHETTVINLDQFKTQHELARNFYDDYDFCPLVCSDEVKYYISFILVLLVHPRFFFFFFIAHFINEILFPFTLCIHITILWIMSFYDGGFLFLFVFIYRSLNIVNEFNNGYHLSLHQAHHLLQVLIHGRSRSLIQ